MEVIFQRPFNLFPKTEKRLLAFWNHNFNVLVLEVQSIKSVSTVKTRLPYDVYDTMSKTSKRKIRPAACVYRLEMARAYILLARTVHDPLCPAR